MTEYCLAQYRLLEQALRQHKQQHLPFSVKLETAFRLSHEHWCRVRSALRDYRFRDPSEEIHFFKVLKPPFTAQISYFSLLYGGWLLQPAGDPAALRGYWLRERQRLSRFKDANPSFYHYLQSGSTHLDGMYFLRSGRPASRLKQGLKATRLCDPYTAPGDQFLGTLRALEKYARFIGWHLLSRRDSQ